MLKKGEGIDSFTKQIFRLESGASVDSEEPKTVNDIVAPYHYLNYEKQLDKKVGQISKYLFQIINSCKQAFKIG